MVYCLILVKRQATTHRKFKYCLFIGDTKTEDFHQGAQVSKDLRDDFAVNF